jgi:hypothetical protein
MKQGGPDVQANALLEWKFSFEVGWSMSGWGYQASGTVKTTDKLNKKKYIDSSSLSDYKVRLDASLKADDWELQYETDNSEWDKVFGAVDWIPNFAQVQPKLPSFDFQLFDIDFFLTTNLLLPNKKVIKFKTTPGARMPRDLYLVGEFIHKA